jgi:succinate dehydrogenase / fumarate reductase cytochrome b subunit
VFLWLMRIGLIAAFAVHMHAAWSLTRMNHRARPTKYASGRDYIAANFASRTMRWTGIIVILFVIFHLADLTWGSANPDFERGDVYHNMVESFSREPVALSYIVANLALAVHIFHGAWSLFASLGVSNPRIVRFRRAFATAFAGIILIGNVSFPIMVQFDVINESSRPIADHMPKAFK